MAEVSKNPGQIADAIMKVHRNAKTILVQATLFTVTLGFDSWNMLLARREQLARTGFRLLSTLKPIPSKHSESILGETLARALEFYKLDEVATTFNSFTCEPFFLAGFPVARGPKSFTEVGRVAC